MRVHLYLNLVSLAKYREGKDVTAHTEFFPRTYCVHVDVHEDEVEVYASGFARIRGKGR